MIDISKSSPIITITSLLVVYAGPISIFFLYIYKKPQLIAILLISSLSSLFGLILTAIIWRVAANVIHIGYFALFGTFIQECCRYYLIHSIYRKIEISYHKSFASMSNLSCNRKEIFTLDDESSSMAAGLGFGLMKSFLIFGNIITKHINSSKSSASLHMFDSSPYISNILGIAIVTILFFLLDFILMPIAFYAEKNGKNIIICMVFLLRLLSTTSMFFNHIENGLYISLGLLLSICLLSVFLLLKLYPEITKRTFMPKNENLSHVGR